MLGGEGGAQTDDGQIVNQALNGSHVGARAGDGVSDAGTSGRAVYQQGTGAANAVLATKMRAGQPLVLAQEIGEVRTRFDLGRDGGAIHGQCDPGQAPASASTRRSVVSCMWRCTSFRPSMARNARVAPSIDTLSPFSSNGLPPSAPITARRV